MKALATVAVVFFFGLSTFANWDLEKRRINYLISSVENLDATFIRNSTEYPAKKAASHLRQKLAYISVRADLTTFTAEDFINLAASKSSLTGQEYLIHFPDGTIVRAGDWLFEQLKYFR